MNTLAEIGPGSKLAVPLLNRLMGDPDLNVQLNAAEALWSITHQPEPSLSAALAHARNLAADQSDRARAVELIGRIRPNSSAIVDLLASVLQKDPDYHVRREAASALGQFGKGAQSALPVLWLGLQDQDAEVRREAIKAIVNIDIRPERVIPHILREIKRDGYALLAYRDLLKSFTPASPEVLTALEDLIKSPEVSKFMAGEARELLAFLRSH